MDQNIHVGKVSDSMEKLTKLCNEKVEQMAKTMNIEKDVEIPFWTADFPELICVATFSKGKDGNITYKLDFSKSTL